MEPAYTIESEFLQPPPRPMPAFVYDSRHVKNRKQFQRGLLIAAVVCAALQFVPPLQQLSDYILPLAYVGWLAVILIVCYLGTLIASIRGMGALRCLTHGEATVGEVESVTRVTTLVIQETESQFAFEAWVRVMHPESGETLSIPIRSDNYPFNQIGRYEVSLQAGEQVTLVYYPGQFDDTVKIYGFLGLNPDVDYIQVAAKGRSVGEIAGVTLLVGFVLSLLMGVLAFERYQPLTIPVDPIAIGAVVAGAIAGLVGGVFIWRYEQQHQRNRAAIPVAAASEEPAADAGTAPRHAKKAFRGFFLGLVVVIVGPCLCAFIAWNAIMFLNAWLDFSEPKFVPVEINERYTETHSLVFRLYKVKFTIEGEDKARERSTSPGQLHILQLSNSALAVVQDGYFGWRWIRGFLPGNIQAPDGGEEKVVLSASA